MKKIIFNVKEINSGKLLLSNWKFLVSKVTSSLPDAIIEEIISQINQGLEDYQVDGYETKKGLPNDLDSLVKLSPITIYVTKR